jgi:hypothetical protein
VAGIAVQVECANVLDIEADLLVLKYARSLHGADQAVAYAVGLDESSMPGEGGYVLVDGPPGIRARQVLFLGVERLHQFLYEQIGQFARRALTTAAEQAPSVRRLAITLHGPGYGLDEVEALNQELHGLASAVAERRHPPALEQIVFVERAQARAERMRIQLPAVIPSADQAPAVPVQPAPPDEEKRHAFVAMPFSDGFDDAFYYGIAPAIRNAGLLCERMDHTVFAGDIVARMRDRIGTAEFMVADVTGSNPNVYLEIGYAWGQGVPTLLVCKDVADLEFDVRGHRCVIYTSIRDLEAKLSRDIPALLAAAKA